MASPTSARKAKKRIIRRRSMLDKALDLPSNLFMNWESDLLLLDFGSFGWPVGCALNGFHFLIKLGEISVAAARRRNALGKAKQLSQANERLQELQNASRTNRVSISTYVSLILIAISLINVVYLFTQKRSYQLAHRQDKIKSPNASLVEQDEASSVPPTLWTYLRHLVTPGRTGQHQIQQLDLWTPSDFNLHIFALYSPLVAILWHFMSAANCWSLLLALGCLVAQTQFLISTYTTLVRDKSTISAEVMHEYDTKFVYPRVFVPKRDASTSTNEAEFINWRQDRRQSGLLKGRPVHASSDELVPQSAPRALPSSLRPHGSPFLSPSPSTPSLLRKEAAKERRRRRETFFS